MAELNPVSAMSSKQLAGAVESVLDLVGVVEVGVVDKALPADGGARLLEVHAHHDHDAVSEFVGKRLEAFGVVDRGRLVVDGAGTDDNGKALVVAVEHVLELASSIEHDLFCLGGEGKAGFQFGRSDQCIVAHNVHVFCR